jgi:hypothetical protein
MIVPGPPTVKLKTQKRNAFCVRIFLLGRQRALHQIIARDFDTVLIKAAMVDSAISEPLGGQCKSFTTRTIILYAIDFMSEI